MSWWFVLQDEEDSLALVFQHVKPEDAGLYTCVASTSTGKISCSAELTVQGENMFHLFFKPLIPNYQTSLVFEYIYIYISLWSIGSCSF